MCDPSTHPMSTETDGRSASAPLAAPTTSTLPHSTHSTDAIDTANQTGGIAFAPIPAGAVPSFFANPFMTPFMPQQAAASSVVPQESGVDASGDYRTNPLPSDAYYLQSVQYQEMMQQYIQTLMVAASTLPTASTADLSQQATDGSVEVVDEEHTEPTEQMLQQQLGAAIPSGSGLASSGNHETSSSNDETTTNPLAHKLEDISLAADQPTAARSVSDDDVVKNASGTSSVDEQPAQQVSAQHSSSSSSNLQDKDDSECSTIANEASSCSEEKEQCDEVSMTEHTEASSSHETVPKIQNVSTLYDKDCESTQPVASASDGGGGVVKARSPQDNSNNSKKDCRTSVLIKKQMNEIDKEINRRIQNKNIKKAALPFGAADVQQQGTAAAAGGGGGPRPSLNQLKTSYGLSQLPSSSLPQQQSQQQQSQQNQQQQSQQAIYQNHFPQHNPSVCAMVKAAVSQQPNQPPMPSLPFAATIPQVPQSAPTFAQPPAAHFPPPPYFPTAQPMFFPGTQQPVTPQLAAALLQQFQQGQQMGLFPMAPFAFGDAQQVQQAQQGQQQSQSQQVSNANTSQTSHIHSQQSHTVHTMPAPLGTVNTAGLSVASGSSGSSGGSGTSATTGGENAIPPPPSAIGQGQGFVGNQPHTPLSNPVSSNSSQVGEEHQWPDENGWNEIGKRHATSTEHTANDDAAEPVWVMRDSYLKRIQREEDRNQETVEAHKNVEKNNENTREEVIEETDRLLSKSEQPVDDEQRAKKASKKEVIVHEPAVLIEGVLFRARYLGSTQLICEGRPTKSSRMMQAQEAVARVKAPAGEIQPSTDIDLFISTEKIMVLNTDLQDILMDHALRTISYIADIGDLVVLMARRMSQSASEEECSSDSLDGARRAPRVICHVFESEEASFIAQSIGQAFQVAYVEFLRANGIDDPSYLREIDYQEVLNSQEMMGEELEMFARKETQKDVVVPKKAGEPLGVVVVESGWGSMLPTVVIANLQPAGAASRCNQLNIGDQIIAINGISLVGLPLASAQQNIKGARSSTAVKLTVVSTPPVVEVRIKRPDTKYQLGFSVQNGVICSLLRGGIAERGGIRVGHRIIEINSQSVVAVAHEKIVNMLATAIGDIHMKTMPTSMFRLLTGQEVPNYI